MEFRPCIDIHNGRVKQIVGGSLQDAGNRAAENFVSDLDAAYYAGLYRKAGITGGHVIMLNRHESEFYNKTKEQALAALREYPGGLQVGGGITPDNAGEFLDAGASHVIVTSYVFGDGFIHYDKLKRMCGKVGRERLVLDVSCRKIDGEFRVVTDRWQKVTDEILAEALLDRLYPYCGEFLIHAVDVEGKGEGIDKELAVFLGSWGKCPVTYAGGVHSYEDLELLREFGQGRLNVTIGSALDLFGGGLSWRKVLEICSENFVK